MRRRLISKTRSRSAAARKFHFGLRALALVLVSIYAGIASSSARAQSGPAPIAVNMTMSICIDDDGATLAGVAPGDAACTSMRPVQTGETPTYYLSNFIGTYNTTCPNGGGPIAKINVPYAQGDVVRIVSTTTQRTEDTGCTGPMVSESNLGASIEWQDSNYAFIMGSWASTGLSNFVSSTCPQNPSNSERFYRGWLLGPSTAAGNGSAELMGRNVQGALNADDDGCPASYTRGFTAWQTGTMTYTGGLTLTTSVTDHFSSGATAYQGVGTSQQLERTYWTQEFGQTRWEKWAPVTWSEPAYPVLTASYMNQFLVAHQNCSAPDITPGQIAPDLVISVDPNTPYGEIHTNPMTGQSVEWLMTLCNDYSNVVRISPTSMMAEVPQVSNPVYWAMPD